MITHKMLNNIHDIWDPLGVIYFAPSDEYKQLTDQIFECINSSMSQEEIFYVLCEVRRLNFNDCQIMENKSCRFVADLIQQIFNLNTPI
jgi:hypothetical protein